MGKLTWLAAMVFFLAKPAFAFEIYSPDFKQDQMIPKFFTCKGYNQSPALSWEGEPPGTVSYALICQDPDAPVGTWVHWVIYNIPASTHMLAQGVPPTETISNGARQGVNDFQRTGYGGPCPPIGQTHRYEFKIYALDTMLPLTEVMTKDKLAMVMNGHVLGEASLSGKFQR